MSLSISNQDEHLKCLVNYVDHDTNMKIQLTQHIYSSKTEGKKDFKDPKDLKDQHQRDYYVEIKIDDKVHTKELSLDELDVLQLAVNEAYRFLANSRRKPVPRRESYAPDGVASLAASMIPLLDDQN